MGTPRTVEFRHADFWVWEGEPGFGQPHQYERAYSRYTRPEFERELHDAAIRCLRHARAIERVEVRTVFEDGTETRTIYRHAEPMTLADYQRLAHALPNVEEARNTPEGRKFLRFKQDD